MANGVVYFGSGDDVEALDAATGAPLWSYATGDEVRSSPAVVNGTVYIGSDDGNLYAFGVTGGSDRSAARHPRPALRRAER